MENSFLNNKDQKIIMIDYKFHDEIEKLWGDYIEKNKIILSGSWEDLGDFGYMIIPNPSNHQELINDIYERYGNISLDWNINLSLYDFFDYNYDESFDMNDEKYGNLDKIMRYLIENYSKFESIEIILKDPEDYNGDNKFGISRSINIRSNLYEFERLYDFIQSMI